MNSEHESQEQELLELLKDYPVPEAQAGFYDQALVQAAHQGTKRQRNRWMMTGFGSAIAAGLAIWVITATLWTTPEHTVPGTDPSIPGVTVMLEEEHTVRLMFASATSLENATLTVTLPDGIELAGFPGQREIAWETSLEEGKNVLPLTLIALTPAGGELLARLEHEDRSRTFRLQVDVS